MKKHRYPTYVLAAIKPTLIKKMVDGDFGLLPTSGNRGKRASDGGFYERVQLWVKKTYGHTIGQGTISQCKKQAVDVQIKTLIEKTTTKAKPTRIKKTVDDSLMLRRLSSQHVFVLLSSNQQAFISGLKAWKKHAQLKPKQLTALKDMYNRYYKKKK